MEVLLHETGVFLQHRGFCYCPNDLYQFASLHFIRKFHVVEQRQFFHLFLRYIIIVKCTASVLSLTFLSVFFGFTFSFEDQ
jgi:hypothetical protein